MYRHTGRSGLWSISVLALLVGLALVLAPVPTAAIQSTTDPPTVQNSEPLPSGEPATPEVASEQHDAGHTSTGHSDDPGATAPDEHHEDGEDSEHGGSSDHAGGSDKLVCSDVNPAWSEIALTGHPLSGHYVRSDGVRSVEFFVFDGPAGGKVVNWHSDGDIDAVILRSGLDAAVYEYDPPARLGSGLLPPLVDREGRNLALVLACFTETAVEVGLDVFLADSSDPVAVDDEFTLVIDITASDLLSDAEITLRLPEELTAIDAPECVVEERTVRCTPPLDAHTEWTIEILVSAIEAGIAVSRVQLDADGEEGPVTTSALEVTRIIGPRGGGGCGGHEDGHEPGEAPDHGEDDECSDDGHGLVAACEAIDPSTKTIVLQGPFASRRYLTGGDGGERIWVSVGETTGAQAATWESNTPVAAALARTGKAIETYLYDPPAVSGSGVVGPAAGSGPRPIADLAFCIVDLPPVDLSLTAGPLPTIDKGRVGTVSLSINNTGFERAEGVTVGIEPSGHVELAGCGRGRMVEGNCEFEGVGPEANHPVEVSLRGLMIGTDEVVFFVAAENESDDQQDNNTLAVEATVVPRRVDSDRGVFPPTPSAAPTTTTIPDAVVLSAETQSETVESSTQSSEGPSTVVEIATLPFTGSRTLAWLTLVGCGLIPSGAALLALSAIGAKPIGVHRKRSGEST